MKSSVSESESAQLDKSEMSFNIFVTAEAIKTSWLTEKEKKVLNLNSYLKMAGIECECMVFRHSIGNFKKNSAILNFIYCLY